MKYSKINSNFSIGSHFPPILLYPLFNSFYLVLMNFIFVHDLFLFITFCRMQIKFFVKCWANHLSNWILYKYLDLLPTIYFGIYYSHFTFYSLVSTFWGSKIEHYIYTLQSEAAKLSRHNLLIIHIFIISGYTCIKKSTKVNWIFIHHFHLIKIWNSNHIVTIH